MSTEDSKVLNIEISFLPAPTAINDDCPMRMPTHSVIQQGRFAGGAERQNQVDDEEELPPDEDEEEPPVATKTKNLRFALESDTETTTSVSESWSLGQYVKCIFLFSIWAVFTVLLAMFPEIAPKPHFIIVHPGVDREYRIPYDDVRGRIGVDISGPFKTVGDEYLAPHKTDPCIDIVVYEYFYKETELLTKKAISDPWRLFTVPEEKFDVTQPQKKERNIKFYENNEDVEEADSSALFLVMTSINIGIEVTTKVLIVPRPMDEDIGIILGSIVLLLLYVMIIWEFISRTFASILTATLALSIMALLSTRPHVKTIITWIDIETLMLLFSMMILVSILSDSGIFDWCAVYAYQLSKGHVWPLVNSLCLFTACLSAFLDSVTMMLLITPIVIRLCEVMDVDPVVVLMFLIFFANVGAACTPVGDPPNIIITTNSYVVRHNINFGNFMLHTVPCVVLVMIQTYIQLRLMFRKFGPPTAAERENKEDRDLERKLRMWERAATGISPVSKSTTTIRNTLMKKANRLKHKVKHKMRSGKKPTHEYEDTLELLRASYGIRNKMLLIKAMTAFVFVLVMFLLHSVHDLHQLSLGWAALTGSLLLLIMADVNDMEWILSRVEWSTLIFFASLFILMEALSLMGLIALVGNAVVHVILKVQAEYRLAVAILIIVWVSAITSAFLDNIPVTTMMIRIVVSLSQNNELKLPLHPLVWSLALGACFGGNGTIIAASANVVCAGVSEQHGYGFSFGRFFRVGFPLMIGNTIVTTFYLLFCHVLFEWHDPDL